MKINEALKQYQRDSGLTGAAIAAQLGLKPRLVNAWLNDENLPAKENLLMCQEFLLEKGYELDELREFSDCIKIIRRFIFKKVITFEDVQKEFSLSNVKMVRKLLLSGKLNVSQKSICLAYAARLLAILEEKERKNHSDQDVVSSVGTVVMLVTGSLKDFLTHSTIAQRSHIRKSNPGLFAASNILNALCSERAFERWAQENN